jgi:hypothetical protein
MVRIAFLALFSFLFGQLAFSASPAQSPLRVGIVELVHGFLAQARHSPEIDIVGVAEPDAGLLSQAATRCSFDRSILFADLDEMLQKVHPQAILVYTNTYDHRRVVEICVRRGVPVMMEKPLAVSLDDALAIEKAAHGGKVQVLVNYETSWYPSNHAAHDLLHEGVLGGRSHGGDRWGKFWRARTQLDVREGPNLRGHSLLSIHLERHGLVSTLHGAEYHFNCTLLKETRALPMQSSFQTLVTTPCHSSTIRRLERPHRNLYAPRLGH